WVSATGFQFAPPSFVLQRPPAAVATKKVLPSCGSSATALVWPLITSLLESGAPNGPIEIHSSACVSIAAATHALIKRILSLVNAAEKVVRQSKPKAEGRKRLFEYNWGD